MKYLLTLMVLCLMTIALGGCSNDITGQNIREDMAKDMSTPGETKDQVDNRIAYVSTVDLRNFNQDLLRFFFLDRPVHSMDYPNASE